MRGDGSLRVAKSGRQHPAGPKAVAPGAPSHGLADVLGGEVCRLESRGGEGSFNHGVNTHTGIHHEVIEAAVIPLALVVTADVFGAASVGGEDFAFGFFGVLGEILFHPANFAGHRGIDKDMKGTGSFGEHARGATAEDDTIALSGAFEEIAADKLDHALTVKNVGIAGVAFQRPEPDGFVEAIEPWIDALVAALDESGSDAGFAGDVVDDAAVDEFPAEAVGEAVGELRTVAAVFPFDGDDLDHSVPLAIRADRCTFGGGSSRTGRPGGRAFRAGVSIRATNSV